MISIVVPVYNVEKYIENCLKSIVNQDYADFELILVDDGSTDRSIDVAKRYLKGTSVNWKLIEKENGGLSSSRNVGLKHCNGDYVVFIDADDVITSDFLYSLRDTINQNNCDFSFCNFKFIDEQIPPTCGNYTEILYGTTDLLYKFLKRTISFVVPSMMFRKSFLTENNIVFDERIKFSEDQMFIWNVIFNCNKAVYLTKQMYGYYIREKSIMTSSSYGKIVDAHSIYKDFTYKLIIQNKRYQNIAKYILPRWELGALWTAAKLINYEEFLQMYEIMDGKNILNRVLGIGEIKAYLLATLSVLSPRMLYVVCKRMK